LIPIAMLPFCTFVLAMIGGQVALVIADNLGIGLWWAIALTVPPFVAVLRLVMPDRYESLRLLRPEMTIRSVFTLVILTWIFYWVEL
jgi:hypothetical protein